MDNTNMPRGVANGKRHGNRWKAERNAEMLALASAGVTQASLARLFHLNKATVSEILRRAGYIKPPKPCAPEGLMWRIVPFAPEYEVSECGHVRCLVRRGPLRAGDLMKSRPNGGGYDMLALSSGGKLITIAIHRLVCAVFHGDPPPGRNFAAHKDDIKSNNHFSNLRWSSRQENMDDAVKNDRIARGHRGYPMKLTLTIAREVRQLRARGEPMRDIARRFDVCTATIRLITSGKIWRDSSHE